MESAIQMIARLREEKKVLLEAILKVEDWALGEGYFLTPSMKARFELVRKIVDNKDDKIPLDKINAEIKPAKTQTNDSLARRKGTEVGTRKANERRKMGEK